MPLSFYARQNAEFTPLRVIIDIGKSPVDKAPQGYTIQAPAKHAFERYAVVDSRTGAYYGIVENDGQHWGARDWEGLSLPVISNADIADSNDDSLDGRNAFANRLLVRADKKGGLPVPEDPEDALGIVGNFLFLPGGGARRFNVYTLGGTHLGTVEGSTEKHAQGLWAASPPSLPEGVQYDVVEAFTRDAAASQLPRDSGL